MFVFSAFVGCFPTQFSLELLAEQTNNGYSFHTPNSLYGQQWGVMALRARALVQVTGTGTRRGAARWHEGHWTCSGLPSDISQALQEGPMQL